MLFVVGRWGDGTTLLAETIRRHGYYFGQLDLPGWTIPEGRNKHGFLEDLPALQIFRKESDDDLAARLAEIRYEAKCEGLRPALKMPWALVRPDLWRDMERVATRAVFITRPSKPPEAYTMHIDAQPAAMVNYPRLRSRWEEKQIPLHEIAFEDLIESPEATIRELADFLDVEFNPGAVEAIDPKWMRNKVR